MRADDLDYWWSWCRISNPTWWYSFGEKTSHILYISYSRRIKTAHFLQYLLAHPANKVTLLLAMAVARNTELEIGRHMRAYNREI